MEQKHLLKVINECKKGNKEAFKSIMIEYTDYLFALAFRFLNNDEDAKDAVQETFIKVWQNINKYMEEVKLTTWMYKICTNCCLDKLKMLKRKPFVSNAEFETTCKTLMVEGFSESIDNKQLAIMIKGMANELTPKQKLVFVLKDIQDLDTDEIVEITGLDKVQIKSNLYCARKEIRNKLIKVGYEV